MKASGRAAALAWLGLSAVLWGSTWVAGQWVAPAAASPGWLLPLRYAGAAAVLLLLSLRRADKPQLGQCAGLGLTMFAAPDLLLLLAEQHGAGHWVPMLYAALPLGLSVAAGQLRGAGLVGLGAAAVLLNGSWPVGLQPALWALPAAGAVVLQGWSLTVLRSQPGLRTTRALAVQMGTAAVLLLLSTAPGWAPPRGLLHGRSLAGVLALGLLGTALPYAGYYRALRALEPTQAAVAEWGQLLVGLAEGALVYALRPTFLMLAASVAMLWAAFHTLRAPREGGQASLLPRP